GLRAFGHLDLDLAVSVAVLAAEQARDLDHAAQRRHRHRHRRRAQQVEAVPLEQLMRLDRGEDVEVAARPALQPGVAVAGEPGPGAGGEARRNAHLQGALAPHLADAVAGLARIKHQPPGAAAARARALDGEETLAGAYAPGAVAAAAHGGAGARRAA